MSTSNTHQQYLADAGSETRPPLLERGSYIPWASHFRRTKVQKEEDLRGDDLKHYEAEIEAMNLILISIPNDIYNSVDACTTAQAMWQRVERLMRETVQNKVDKETRFNNEFDQFVAKIGEALVSIYNHFAQLMNDLERNGIIFPKVTVNTKFLNCLQPKWLKYVTQVRLVKRLTGDTYDDLFDYLQQFEKLVNAYRAKKLEKSHDPLALVAYTSSSSRTTSPYYVTHPTSVVDYDDDYQGDANDAGNIQRTLRTTSSGTAVNVQCYNCSEKGHYACNCPNPRVHDSKYFMEQMLLAKHDEAGVILTDDHNDFLFVDASWMEEIEELSTNTIHQLCDTLFAKDKQEKKYPKQPKIINNIIGDDQIDNDIIFDEPNVDVNSGSVEYGNNVQESYELEQLARNAYKEAEKQQIIAKSSTTKHSVD
ncbi:integrase, catalytic region, zinc finger, CCHC-type containing protein [Tanacetum coccineum]